MNTKSSVIQPTPVPSPGSQGVSSPDRGSADVILRREGTREEVASAVMETGHSVRTFVAPTENTDNDIGWSILRNSDSTNR